MRWISAFLICFSFWSAFGQVAIDENPFELSERVEQLKMVEQQRIAANPFEKVILLEHQKAETSTKPQVKRPKKTVSFVFWLILLILVLLSLITSMNAQVLTRLYRSLTNTNFLKLQHRAQKAILSGEYMYLYALFFLNASLFLYLSLTKLNILVPYESIRLYFFLMLILVSVVFFRHIAMAFIGWVFPISQEIHQFNFTISVFNMSLGLILVPLNVLIAYAPEAISKAAIYLAFAVIIFLFLYRFLRGFILGNKYLFFHKFHFFAYLCAVELGPLFIGIKWLFFDSSNV